MSGWAASCTTPIHIVFSLWLVNESLLSHFSHNSRGRLSHCVQSIVNVNRSLCPWQPRDDNQGQNQLAHLRIYYVPGTETSISLRHLGKW